MTLVCIDDHDLEEFLVEGVEYLCEPMPVGAVRVLTDHGWIIVARSRFGWEWRP